ncbi:Crp/Fnr family transcriptional regulator [Devosia pacifica]|nr:Crp/Fnr family transcriptional regulator [Devosia pacifica]
MMRLEEAAALLSRAEFFDICDAEQRRLLAFSSERRQFAADEVVFKSDSIPGGAYLLISGTLKAQPDGGAAGKPYTISEAGSILAPMALFLARPRHITVTAVIETDTLFVPRDAFRKLLTQSPDLAERAAEVLRANIGSFVEALEPARRRMHEQR